MKTKPQVIDVFSDNGELSHWALIDPETGVKLWSEDPEECKAMGHPVKPSDLKELKDITDEDLIHVAKILKPNDEHTHNPDYARGYMKALFSGTMYTVGWSRGYGHILYENETEAIEQSGKVKPVWFAPVPVNEKEAVNVVLKRRISEHCEQLQKLKDVGVLSIFLEQNKDDIESLKSFLFPSPPTGDNKNGKDEPANF